ncbi:MAG: 3-phosphoshikimate 1-carboxyvinyltransferase [Chitinophagaceae bacterium]
MQAVISPSKLNGTIKAPPSKSAMQRACAAALIKGGETILHNPGTSADDKAALNIIQQLGAIVEYRNDAVVISSDGINPLSNEINCGESGLSVRMFSSIAALADKEITITGSGSLLNRPLKFFDTVFPLLNVECESNKGFLPLTIEGPLQPKDITIDGSLSSQFLTGLFFAYSAADAENVTITVNNLKSKPYVDLTLEILEEFHLQIPKNDDYDTFYFKGQLINYSTDQPFNYTIEGDWSNAAFLLVAGAIAGDITVSGLKMNSVQGDKSILDVLRQAGAKFEMKDDAINIAESALQAFTFDATDCPDLFPPLVALAAHCEGVSTIMGVSRLLHKESNRAISLQEEFRKMNVIITVEDDSMIIKGVKEIPTTDIFSHNDHRIAMACAVAGLKTNGTVYIRNSIAVRKSYPNFFEDLKKLNANVREEETSFGDVFDSNYWI